MSRFALILLIATLSTHANASNYPPDYGYQEVRVVHKGAALFAHVGSGIIEKEVIGYKNSGTLAQFNPESIEAVVSVSCRTYGYNSTTKTTVVRLGREWHGTGYISSGHERVSFMAPDCDYQSVEAFQIAFSDGRGNWDSDYGRNYSYGRDDLWGNRARPTVFQTHEGGYQINLRAWDFIVDQMRR